MPCVKGQNESKGWYNLFNSTCISCLKHIFSCRCPLPVVSPSLLPFLCLYIFLGFSVAIWPILVKATLRPNLKIIIMFKTIYTRTQRLPWSKCWILELIPPQMTLWLQKKMANLPRLEKDHLMEDRSRYKNCLKVKCSVVIFAFHISVGLIGNSTK